MVAPDGRIAQIGNFRDKLWHAGRSFWKGRNGLNSYSIGIEVTCPGPVDFVKEVNGIRFYKTWYGELLNNSENDIIEARHPNGGPVRGWVRFTKAQLDVLVEVGSLLMNHYGLKEAVRP